MAEQTADTINKERMTSTTAKDIKRMKRIGAWHGTALFVT